MRPFSIGETLYGIRDLEQSHPCTVLGFDDRGAVLVRFEDGIPRALSVASLQRAGTKKDEPRAPSADWEQATTLGQYISLLESRHSKENK